MPVVGVRINPDVPGEAKLGESVLSLLLPLFDPFSTDMGVDVVKCLRAMGVVKSSEIFGCLPLALLLLITAHKFQGHGPPLTPCTQ